MLHSEIIVAPLELKFTDGSVSGDFSGYAAVFGNMDSHGDVIMPGAFDASLAERKAQGRTIPMHVMHGVFGGDGLPVGVWSNVAEDQTGLKVDGKISGMNTDAGRLLYERVKDGALAGLSIGYRIKKGGVSYGNKPGEPKRILKALDLAEISLVDDPANAQAKVQEIKARRYKADPGLGGPGDPQDLDEEAWAGPDVEDAVENLTTAIMIQDQIMSGSWSGWGSVKDAALLMDALRAAYEDLTGERIPEGLDGWMKKAPTIREIEKGLREEFDLSHNRAREIAKRRFGSLPRDEGRTKAVTPANSFADLSEALSGFTLPKL